MPYWLDDPAARTKSLAELRVRQFVRRAKQEAARAAMQAMREAAHAVMQARRGAAAKRGEDACRSYLRSQMYEPFGDAELSNQGKYKFYCTERFQISARVFFKIWTDVAAETKCPRAKPGRPPKSRDFAPAPKGSILIPDSILILEEPTLEGTPDQT
jgi:hypothetical protein